MVFEAVKVALDPTPAQERLLLSHAGASRFAFNAALAHVKAGIEAGEKPEWSFYSLVRWWNANKDTLAVGDDGVPWWAENSKEAANTGLRSLAAALSNWAKSRKGQRKGKRVGFPRFRAKVARIHAHVANQRSDAMHKLTTRLARTYSDVSVEDLNTAGMARNRRLAKAVSDASFAEFRRQLEYKTARTGAALRVIDRWYPSSKTCSKCGRVKAKLSLAERTYTCDGCGLVMDRDLNAAINIKVAGSAPETINAHRETVSRGGQLGRATQVPVKCEPSVGGNVVSDLEPVPARTPCKLQQSSLQRAKKGEAK